MLQETLKGVEIDLNPRPDLYLNTDNCRSLQGVLWTLWIDFHPGMQCNWLTFHTQMCVSLLAMSTTTRIIKPKKTEQLTKF